MVTQAPTPPSPPATVKQKRAALTAKAPAAKALPVHPRRVLDTTTDKTAEGRLTAIVADRVSGYIGQQHSLPADMPKVRVESCDSWRKLPATSSVRTAFERCEASMAAAGSNVGGLAFQTEHLIGLHVAAAGSAGTQREILAHEIGHAIDFHLHPTWDGNLRRRPSAEVQRRALARAELMRVIDQTPEVQELRRHHETLKKHRQPGDSRFDNGATEYLLDTRELYARAYSQFIATSSGDTFMHDSLMARRNHPSMTKRLQQWEPANFTPVQLAFERYFRTLSLAPMHELND